MLFVIGYVGTRYIASVILILDSFLSITTTNAFGDIFLIIIDG